MTIKVIKTEDQYLKYLEEVHLLISKIPLAGTADSDKLELLSVLIEAYENSRFPIKPPDPIDAIQFRMEEKGLKQVDLAPYIGTKSRVSEVLNRKRPLTVSMIKALSVGLGISAEILLGMEADKDPQIGEPSIDWSRFPISEMIARGWIEKISNKTAQSTSEQVQNFISQIGWGNGIAAFKRTLNGDAYSPTTKYSLYAWLSRVVQKGREKKSDIGVFDPNVFSSAFLKKIANLSWFESGPKLAVEFLEKNGIAIVFEPALRGTMLDGAAMMDENGLPIVALTLRHDRLDNFWFTLMHEIVHIWKHVNNETAFLDDLDSSSEDKREAEANRLAREAFIPRVIWKRSEAFLSPSKESIDKLSRELKIHPSIIAGRLRREQGNFQVFTDLVGYGEVKKHFSLNDTRSES